MQLFQRFRLAHIRVYSGKKAWGMGGAGVFHRFFLRVFHSACGKCEDFGGGLCPLWRESAEPRKTGGLSGLFLRQVGVSLF